MNPNLTPPSSKNSTPLRPQDASSALASPSNLPKSSSNPHPLRADHLAESEEGEGEEGISTEEESGDEMDIIEGMDPMSVSTHTLGDTVEGEVDDEMKGSLLTEDDGDEEGVEEVGNDGGKGKGKAVTGKRKTRQPPSAKKRGPAGKGRKENELYETDIVEQWHHDIIAERRQALKT